MGYSTFLDNAVTRAASVTGINSAVRAASLDPDKIIKIPGRWPKALVHNMGGEIDQFNGGIHHRTFGVTICGYYPRAVLGGYAEKQLSDLSELMITEFTHTREDSSIRLLATTTDICEQVGEGELYMVTCIFEYFIE